MLGLFVPGTGFEPAHLAAPPPEDGASTNFATRASCSVGLERAANIVQLTCLLQIFSVLSGSLPAD